MKKIPIPIFNLNVELYVGDVVENIKKLNKAHSINHLEDDYKDGWAWAFYFYDNTNYKRFAIFLPKKCPATTISHECLHISWHILQHVGIDIDGDNHEMLAYLQTYISTEIAKRIGGTIIISKSKRK